MAIDLVPVRIDADAAERIAELGLGTEVAEAAELAKRMISELHSVDVKTWIDYDEGTGINIQMIAWKDAKFDPRDPQRTSWQMAAVEQLSPQFRRWVVCSMYPYEAQANGR
jgi:hypothetical protein